MDKTLADLLAELKTRKQSLEGRVKAARDETLALYEQTRTAHNETQKRRRRQDSQAGPGEWYYAAKITYKNGRKALEVSRYPDTEHRALLPRFRTGPLAKIVERASAVRPGVQDEVIFIAPEGLQTEREFRSAPIRLPTTDEVNRLWRKRMRHMRSLNDVLAEHPKAHPRLRKAQEALRLLEHEQSTNSLYYSFVLLNMGLLEKPVMVKKGGHKALGSRQAYSVWLGDKDGLDDQPIFLYGERIRGLRVTDRSRPLELFDVDPKYVRVEEAQALMGLAAGDLITPSGYKITDRTTDERIISQAMVAKHIYRLVFEGTEILPDDDEVLGYRVPHRRVSQGVGDPVIPHTEEQKYLKSLGPVDIKPGRLLGSGCLYLAFYFPKVVFTESDEDNRATYAFLREQFETLKEWRRERIYREKPQGYIDRIIHYDDGFEEWKDRVHAILQGPY